MGMMPMGVTTTPMRLTLMTITATGMTTCPMRARW